MSAPEFFFAFVTGGVATLLVFMFGFCVGRDSKTAVREKG